MCVYEPKITQILVLQAAIKDMCRLLDNDACPMGKRINTAIKVGRDALAFMATCKDVDADPDDYYTEPPDGSHGMLGVPGR